MVLPLLGQSTKDTNGGSRRALVENMRYRSRIWAKLCSQSIVELEEEGLIVLFERKGR
jgi:hypothetical protein